MTKIAIIGKYGEKTIKNTLIELFKISGLTAFYYDCNRFGTFKQLADESADVFIAPISTYLLEKNKLNIDIVIFASSENNSFSISRNSCLNLINEHAIVIINADDKDIYKYLIGSRANLLTYGFNSKASVTASSILENMDSKFIQICVQRSFKTINGLDVEAQEIPVTLPLIKDEYVLNEIAAITAALAMGVVPRIITLFAGSK